MTKKQTVNRNGLFVPIDNAKNKALVSGYTCWELANAVNKLLLENEQLHARIAELEKQEMHGMDCTLDQMLSIEQQKRWGLDKQEHGRNIQLMFCRALDAIDAMESQLKTISVWVAIAARHLPQPCFKCEKLQIMCPMYCKENEYKYERHPALKIADEWIMNGHKKDENKDSN
jgi:hypothetical protein